MNACDLSRNDLKKKSPVFKKSFREIFHRDAIEYSMSASIIDDFKLTDIMHDV